MILSHTPKLYRSSAVIFIRSAASFSLDGSFHRIDANPLGEITEYKACSSIASSSHTASASAPPLPPSPSTTDITGVFSVINSAMFLAIASP